MRLESILSIIGQYIKQPLMMKNFYSLILVFLFLSQNIFSQISFTNRNDLLSKSDFHSGVAIGVVDMNGDGLDDIVRMDDGKLLTFEYQNIQGIMFSTYEFGSVTSISEWSICVADVDKNGFNDVITGGSYNDVKLVKANFDGTVYEMSDLPGSSIFVQGSNFADINNDGMIDYFACHDNAESRIWGNDGMGNLVQQDGWINMSTNPISDNSGNYGSIWTDFDNDGDLDLYIAKCRQGVTDVTDPRRINQLFVNDGSGNYTEMAEEYGLKIGWQSWTADFQDVNNDGFMDCFVTNHDYISQLLINDGTGHYIDVTATSGINVNGTPVQGVMRDFDNDGFVDILVAGQTQHLFHNNGDTTFTEVAGVFDINEMESFAIGDLNNDGFVDIYGGYANIYSTPSNIDDVLWMNNTNNNNYFAVNTIGVESNRNGIGARIEIYGDWGIQVREVRSGESYGIMNSMHQYFGLGTATEVDSMIIRWPSGEVDLHTNIQINQKMTVVEGGCLGPDIAIEALGATSFCTGSNVVLSAPLGFDNYQWSTGATTPTIEVSTQGTFIVTVTNADGCFSFAQGISTFVDPVIEPMIIEDGKLKFCEGESVLLSEVGAPTALSYTWSNGATGNTLEVTASGIYSVTAEGVCEDYVSNAIEVEVILATPTTIADTIHTPSSAELFASGSNLTWYDVPTGGTPIGFGNNFITPVIDMTTTYYVEGESIEDGIDESVGKEAHTGGSLYSGDQNSNNLLIFDAFEPFVLNSVKVFTDLPGSRKITLVDFAGAVLQEKVVDVEYGDNIIELNMEIPAGTDLALTTDSQHNMDSLGIGGPRFQRSSLGVNFPYEIDGIVSLKSSNLGDSYYYYFYDWKIKSEDIVCLSDRVPVIALYDPSLSFTNFDNTGEVEISPNPSNGKINLVINFDATSNLEINVIDLTGKVLLENTFSAQENIELDLNHLGKGIYFVQVKDGGHIYSGRVVLQ